MDGIYDPLESPIRATENIIRSQFGGLCSNEPFKIFYAGVPSAVHVLKHLAIDENKPLSEEDWYRIFDFVADFNA